MILKNSAFLMTTQFTVYGFWSIEYLGPFSAILFTVIHLSLSLNPAAVTHLISLHEQERTFDVWQSLQCSGANKMQPCGFIQTHTHTRTRAHAHARQSVSGVILFPWTYVYIHTSSSVTLI